MAGATTCWRWGWRGSPCGGALEAGDGAFAGAAARWCGVAGVADGSGAGGSPAGAAGEVSRRERRAGHADVGGGRGSHAGCHRTAGKKVGRELGRVVGKTMGGGGLLFLSFGLFRPCNRNSSCLG